MLPASVIVPSLVSGFGAYIAYWIGFWRGRRYGANPAPICHICGCKLRRINEVPLKMDGFLDQMPSGSVWYCPGTWTPPHGLRYYGPLGNKPESLTEL